MSRGAKAKHEQSKLHKKNLTAALEQQQQQQEQQRQKRRRINNDQDDDDNAAVDDFGAGAIDDIGGDEFAGADVGGASASAADGDNNDPISNSRFSPPADALPADCVVQFFAACSTSLQSLSLMPFDVANVFRTTGARLVPLTTPEQTAVDSKRTLEVLGMLVKHRTTRDFGNELLSILNAHDNCIAGSLEMAHKVARSRTAVVSVRSLGTYFYRDPIDVLVEILRTLRRVRRFIYCLHLFLISMPINAKLIVVVGSRRSRTEFRLRRQQI